MTYIFVNGFFSQSPTFGYLCGSHYVAVRNYTVMKKSLM